MTWCPTLLRSDVTFSSSSRATPALGRRCPGIRARLLGVGAAVVMCFVGGMSTTAGAEGLRDAGLPADQMPAELAAVDVEEHLGAVVDPALTFRSESGAPVSMGDLLVGDVPTLLTLNYFTCETLCSLQLNAVLDGLRALDWVPGEEFRVVTVSIDPNEDAALAASKKDTYIRSLGKGDGVEWHFLTGEQEAITALADTVGYRYSYDEKTGQYAHPAVIAFISPEGTVARYVYGVRYTAMDLKFALMEAAAGRVGSPAERLILSCFRYDETVGKYTPFAFGIMRLGGLVTMAFLGVAGFVLWRREWMTRGHGSES